MGGHRCCNPHHHPSDEDLSPGAPGPAPVSRPSVFQKEKYPTEDKSSETVELIGKLGEIYIWFGMREMARNLEGTGIDKKAQWTVISGLWSENARRGWRVWDGVGSAAEEAFMGTNSIGTPEAGLNE